VESRRLKGRRTRPPILSGQGRESRLYLVAGELDVMVAHNNVDTQPSADQHS